MSFTVATYTPFNSISQILRFPSDLKFRIYYLEAPLSILGEQIYLKQLQGNLLSINGYHTGIGFQSLDVSRPYQFTYDYIVASGFSFTSLLPKIVTDNQGNRDLIWNNRGEITQGNFIDKVYWERSTYVTTLSSDQVVKLQEWILNVWIPRNPIYSLLSAIKSEDPNDIFNPIFRPSICDTFCYSAFYYLQNIDGGDQLDPMNGSNNGLNTCIEYVTVPNCSVSGFIMGPGSDFVPVDYESNKDAIIDFYIAFEDELNSLVDLTAEIEKLLKELESAPIDQKPALIRQILQDIFTIITLALTIYEQFDEAYYYGYGVGDKIDTPQYWKLINPITRTFYINSNILNSYKSWTDIGNTIIDNYSRSLNCDCNCKPPTKDIIENNKFNSFWFIILFIVFIIIIVVIIIAIIIYNRRDNV